MPKKIRLEVTQQELSFISEALEVYAGLMAIPPEELLALFKRIDDRRCREEGEPEEGY